MEMPIAADLDLHVIADRQIARRVVIHELTRAAVVASAWHERRTQAESGQVTIDLLADRDPRDLELIKLRGPVPGSLEQMAFVYNLAAIVGLPPVRQVELELGLPHSTASAWIRKAKEQKLIGPERIK
jgi:hypothetical protein